MVLILLGTVAAEEKDFRKIQIDVHCIISQRRDD
jgi:hypothetical protein